MKNKLYVLSSAALASMILLACGGGGDKPVTPVSERGIKIELKNPSATFSFGDSITEDDLLVTMAYSDGSSKILSSDKYTPYVYDMFYGRIDIKFPIPIAYNYGSRSKTINIHTNDDAYSSSIKISNIQKDYEFENGSEGILKVKYTDTTFNFANPLENKGAQKITYKSSKKDIFEVNGNGLVTAKKDFTEDFTGATISAYVDGIKVDDYSLTKFTDTIYEGIDLTSRAAKCKDNYKESSFQPTDGKLTFPSIIDNLVIDRIGNDGFKNCENIKYLELPETIKQIGENAFSGCTNLDNGGRTLDIPHTVNRIASNAFLGTKISDMWFEDPYNWYYTYQDPETKEIEYGDVDPEYLSDKTIAAKIFTREDLCCATFLKF